MFQELKRILGEPFEITNRNIHRWKIRDYTFSVFHWRNEKFGYNVLDERGLYCSSGEGLNQDEVIETARWAIRKANRD